MAVYELTFLLNDEEELKKIKEVIEASSGTVVNEESWGKRPLSYPIKKNTSANFYNWRIKIEKKYLQELRKKLSFNEKLIRHLLLEME